MGDTVTINNRPATEALGGYKDPRPMVYSGLYPIDGSDYPALRDALDKLKLNDAALVYEPESSAALGFGFRCGFLGLLHLEIIQERLEREFGLDLISTAPNVVYRVQIEGGEEVTVTNPSEFPSGKIASIWEPTVRATILAPNDYVGAVMELCQGRRGQLKGMDYLSSERVELRYTLPLAEIIYDFFDQLKSRTKGYASLDYEPSGEQESDLVKVDILLHATRWTRSARSSTRTRRTTTASPSLQAPEADPPAAVRGADPGRDRQPDHRPRDDPRDPQGRAREVLRR